MNKFIPRKYKYSKIRKKLKFKRSVERKHIILKNGTIGLKCAESGRISSSVLEAIRRSISRRIKKVGKMEIFIHPNIPLTKKPVGVRMGKGSGNLDSWVAPIKKGKIILELKYVPFKLGILALKAAAHKLPVKSFIITK